MSPNKQKGLYLKKLLAMMLITLCSLASAAQFDPECTKRWEIIDPYQLEFTKYKNYKNLCDHVLKRELIRAAKYRHRSLSYKKSKVVIFSKLDNVDGVVCSVYDDRCMRTRKVPNHRIMNVEHTWPKSKGAKTVPAVSDLHHLFPTDSEVNSKRSSHPFCEVRDVKWTNGLSSLGTSGRKGYCFEPPKEHRGNIARAMFYFAVRYNKRIDNREEKWLKKWHKDDPIDQAEIERNKKIIKIQKNTNPFIDYPEFVELISDF